MSPRVLAWLGALAAALTFAATVRGQSPHNKLQHRIDAAGPGDTVFVPPGTFDGDLTLPKRLALIGSAGSVLRGSGNGTCLTITADSCVVRDLVVERSGRDLTREDAAILLKSSHNILKRLTIRDALFGIYLLSSHGNLIEDNSISEIHGLDLGQRGNGIHVWNSHENTFLGNAITGTRDGLYFLYANRTRAERNSASQLRYGLHYMYSDSNEFVGNVFVDNLAGAAIMYSTDIRFRHNLFVQNRGFSSYGILFQDCHNVLADSNIIADNVVGMFFEAATDNVFRHNIIARNEIALTMFQNSQGNAFSENNFVDNVNALVIVGKRTDSRWSMNGRGNFWSDYDGYDLDGDGVGDVPLRIQNVFEYLEGKFPNTRLYLYSPVAQALASATKAFPIVEITHEEDPYPLMRPAELTTIPASALSRRMTDAQAEQSPGPLWLACGVPVCLLAAAGWSTRRLLKRRIP